jgi:hypothetical protein
MRDNIVISRYRSVLLLLDRLVLLDQVARQPFSFVVKNLFSSQPTLRQPTLRQPTLRQPTLRQPNL